jgi:hypothetical protein
VPGALEALVVVAAIVEGFALARGAFGAGVGDVPEMVAAVLLAVLTGRVLGAMLTGRNAGGETLTGAEADRSERNARNTPITVPSAAAAVATFGNETLRERAATGSASRSAGGVSTGDRVACASASRARVSHAASKRSAT